VTAGGYRREFIASSCRITSANLAGSKKKVEAVGTESSQCEQKVPIPDWLTNPNMEAAFRKLPADERARLEALQNPR
jgi:hypothetical protein